ncbi:hypothetical protein DRQ26_01195 [bacterium]|nr:MAG: hypothetical protein DRQ26_01195 [bacterium]
MDIERKDINAAVFLSVVIPVFNEQDNIDELIKRCLEVCCGIGKSFEIILVDDGSTDNSAKIISNHASMHKNRVVGVFLNKNYGQHAAVMAGFEESKGEIVITLDADLQNPPEEISRLAAKIDEGFDVVGSVRLERQDNLFRKISSLIINEN